jgi:hypothetical protein
VRRLIGLVGVQGTVGLAAQLPRRWLLDQGDELAALVLGEPRLAAGTGVVTKPVQTLGVEPLDALAHGLGVAVELGGDLAGPRAVPAAGDHPGAGKSSRQGRGGWPRACGPRVPRRGLGVVGPIAGWARDLRVGSQEATKPITPIIHSQIEEHST